MDAVAALLPDLGVFWYGALSFALLVFASWCVGEGGEILGERYDASIIGGLLIAWLNTGERSTERSPHCCGAC
jgi:hypothetical protein